MESLFLEFGALVAVRDFFELGGEVLILIAILSVIMWGLICERIIFFYTAHRRQMDIATTQWSARVDRRSWHATQIRNQLLSVVAQGMERRLGLIKTCVALCPLLGLLGTVTGMIEVFEVMAISGSGNPRSMAAGVSKATVPTMAGMVAALSGLAMSAYLQRVVLTERTALNERLSLVN